MLTLEQIKKKLQGDVHAYGFMIICDGMIFNARYSSKIKAFHVKQERRGYTISVPFKATKHVSSYAELLEFVKVQIEFGKSEGD